jgi:hypothetical protein
MATIATSAEVVYAAVNVIAAPRAPTRSPTASGTARQRRHCGEHGACGRA